MISIHALLAESDPLRQLQFALRGNFYPRSPCGERQPATSGNDKNNIFLSTLSLRRATRSNQSIISQANNFYPRSPCGERLEAPARAFLISYFYPRSPCGERPFEKFEGVMVTKISIHALLAESDPPRVIREPATSGFLSTLSLRRATFQTSKLCNLLLTFLSTLSLRRATLYNFHSFLAIFEFLSTLSLRRATVRPTG